MIHAGSSRQTPLRHPSDPNRLDEDYVRVGYVVAHYETPEIRNEGAVDVSVPCFVDLDYFALQRIPAELAQDGEESLLLLGRCSCYSIEDLAADNQISGRVGHDVLVSRLLRSSSDWLNLSWKSGRLIKRALLYHDRIVDTTGSAVLPL